MKTFLPAILILYLAVCLLPFAGSLPVWADDLPTESNSLSATESLPAEPQQTLPQSYPVFHAATGEQLQLSPAEYIKGVVAAEMPLSYGEEALKAQAIACHSLALFRLSQQGEGYSLSTDHTVLQGYLSLEERQRLWGEDFAQWETLLDAVAEEALQWILTYQAAPAEATYFALSSGRTENAKDVWGGDLPYLTGVDSSQDLQCAQLQSDITLPKAEISAAVSEFLGKEDDGSFSTLAVLSRTESGMVLSALCGDSILSGVELRTLFSLPSANFTLSEEGDSLTFHCIGKGHGVGMSQFGAGRMAAEGSTFRQILAHYYPGTALTPLSELL